MLCRANLKRAAKNAALSTSLPSFGANSFYSRESVKSVFIRVSFCSALACAVAYRLTTLTYSLPGTVLTSRWVAVVLSQQPIASSQ